MPAFPSIFAWLVLPCLFAALLALLRRGTEPADREEKTVLLCMLAPFALGAALTVFGAALPEIVPSRLPIEPLEGAGQGIRGPSGERGVSFSWSWGRVMAGLGALYAAGLGIGLARIVRNAGRMRRAARAAMPSGLGERVFLTAALPTAAALPGGVTLLSERLARALSPEELHLIVLHEAAHHRRGDPRYFAFLILVDAVFWFHPSVRRQTARCRIAAELACDEAVCASRPKMRKAYATVIVTALKHAAGSALPCAPAVFSPRTKGEFGMRIEAIMRPNEARGKRRGLALGAALALFLPLALGQWAAAQGTGTAALTAAPIEEGRLTSPFGQRPDPVNGKVKTHKGTDIAAPKGTPVMAAGDGVVSVAERKGGHGLLIEITHAGDVVTRYAQLDTLGAREGDRVRAGETIGTVGASGRATGPHLHLEVLVAGEHVDPQADIRLP